jgi:3-deoxy-manno-octulosonate cytidylyltransferase (CMP-KDO synthetase)
LEQLRWLQNGFKIRVAMTEFSTIGIDTPQDLERAKELLTHPDLTQGRV